MCMKCCSFSIGADEIVVENFIKRYHFEEKDKDLIRSAGIFLAGIVKVESAVVYQETGVVCAITLGRHYDELESITEASGNLLLTYCMECLGMEFLNRAYEKVNGTVFEEKGKWLGGYRFFDSMDVEQEGWLQSICEACGISFQNGMMRPLKSVIFTAEYKEDKNGSGHDCSSCENLSCDFRKT